MGSNPLPNGRLDLHPGHLELPAAGSRLPVKTFFPLGMQEYWPLGR